MKALEQFQPASPMAGQPNRFSTTEKAAEMDQPLRQPQESPLKGVRSNIVQSIRAFQVHDLQAAAAQLGQHFLYANLAQAQRACERLALGVPASELPRRPPPPPKPRAEPGLGAEPGAAAPARMPAAGDQ